MADQPELLNLNALKVRVPGARFFASLGKTRWASLRMTRCHSERQTYHLERQICHSERSEESINEVNNPSPLEDIHLIQQYGFVDVKQIEITGFHPLPQDLFHGCLV